MNLTNNSGDSSADALVIFYIGEKNQGASAVQAEAVKADPPREDAMIGEEEPFLEIEELQPEEQQLDQQPMAASSKV